MTQQTILRALDAVGAVEGGYVNDPDDPGGETNHGVTIGFLKSIRPGSGSDDLKRLTKEEARSIFYSHFVVLPGIHRLPDVVQAEMVGLSVNAGPKAAIKVLQQICGSVVDGSIGPNTIRAAQGVSNEDIKRAVDGFYHDVVARRPTSAKYIKGWLRRSQMMNQIPLDLGT